MIGTYCDFSGICRSFLMRWQLRALRHRQLKDRLDEELVVEAKAEEALKAKARALAATETHRYGAARYRC